MGKRKDFTYWNVAVPRGLNDIVEKAIKLGMHASKSDFIRDAVRIKLAHMGLSLNDNKHEGENNARS